MFPIDESLPVSLIQLRAQQCVTQYDYNTRSPSSLRASTHILAAPAACHRPINLHLINLTSQISHIHISLVYLHNLIYIHQG